jgi:hypothetical protein
MKLVLQIKSFCSSSSIWQFSPLFGKGRKLIFWPFYGNLFLEKGKKKPNP